ncbi:MAG: hypothetical protein WBW92_13710, partial [Rhodanobacteraceae bacterium]
AGSDGRAGPGSARLARTACPGYQDGVIGMTTQSRHGKQIMTTDTVLEMHVSYVAVRCCGFVTPFPGGTH